MSWTLLGKHLVSRSWCRRWSGIQHMSRTFGGLGHQMLSPIYLTTDQFGLQLSRCATGSLLRVQSFHCSSIRLKESLPVEPPPRELDLNCDEKRNPNKTPKPALYLGLSGLIPFVTAPLLMVITKSYLPEVAFAQVAYGAFIVSFLGGVRWGFALPEGSPAKPNWLNLTNSVVPSLLAWCALLCIHDIKPSCMFVIVGLGISLLPTYPGWFKAQRTILTVVAFLSLVGTLFIKELYPEKRYFEQE